MADCIFLKFEIAIRNPLRKQWSLSRARIRIAKSEFNGGAPSSLFDNMTGPVYFHENRLVFILSKLCMETYDSKTASRLVGVSLRQLQYWDEQDFIRPSVKLAEGRGTRRLYSFHDLVCLKVVKDLAHHGFTLQKIRRCLGPLKKDAAQTERPAPSLKYLTDGEKLFVITDDRRTILNAIERQFVVSLGIGNLVRELGSAAKRAASVAEHKRKKPPRLEAKASA